MSCFNQNIDLQWINTLGGWEHWRFTARKTYGYDISDTETIERDIFQNWDSDFLLGQTASEHTSIKAVQRIIVRSQDLTAQQVNAIARIKFSIRVNDETDPDNIKTVLVDKGSIDYRIDKEKRSTIEFAITYPGIIIQSL